MRILCRRRMRVLGVWTLDLLNLKLASMRFSALAEGFVRRAKNTFDGVMSMKGAGFDSIFAIDFFAEFVFEPSLHSRTPGGAVMGASWALRHHLVLIAPTRIVSCTLLHLATVLSFPLRLFRNGNRDYNCHKRI